MERNGPISPVTIELREEFYAAEFSHRLPCLSGAWGIGMWRHPKAWRIECAVHFAAALPDWRIEGRELVVAAGTRRVAWVEWWEHWVLAKDREQAMGCLVRDLRRDAAAEWITHAAVYRVRPPLERALVTEIERYNRRLLLERTRAGVGATHASPVQNRQLEMALV